MADNEPSPRSLLVLNSTEWRNLCARGSIRVLTARRQSASAEVTPAELARAFATAPTTKPDSSVDTFVLELRPEWPATARRHAIHEAIAYLDLDDVLSHHVVASQDYTYYKPQAEDSGVELSSRVFETEWRAWSTTEEADACLEAAHGLMNAFQIRPAATADMWQPLVHAVTSKDFQSEALAPLHRRLLRSASKLDDAAASVRGSQAYWLATAFEWVDEVTGVYPRDVAGRHVLSYAWGLASGKQLSWSHSDVHEVERALLAIQEHHESAFGDGVSALSVGRLVRLLAESRHTLPKMESLIEMISATSELPGDDGALVCVVAASAIGPEHVRQLVRHRQSLGLPA